MATGQQQDPTGSSTQHVIQEKCPICGQPSNDKKIEPSPRDYLQIYCQNLSGAKSKIRKINHLLIKTVFQLICFQFSKQITMLSGYVSQ